MVDWVLPHVERYYDYVGFLLFNDSQGDYPHMEDMMTELEVDWEEEYDNRDGAYYRLHTEYVKHVNKIENIIQQIEQCDLLNKVKSEEVCFISRNYPLARALGDLFDFPEFYYRKLVDADELLDKLQQVDTEGMHESVDHTIRSSISVIEAHKEGWVFEVYVK